MTAGPTSAADDVVPEPRISHTSELIERHSITILAADLPTGHQARLDVTRLHAEAYARARGFEIAGLSQVSGSSTVSWDSAFNGVEFELTVGRGDIDLDQSTPGALDHWRWSGPAVDWWRRILNRDDARQGRVLARREDRDRGRRVVPGPWRGADAVRGTGVGITDTQPPWMRRADGDDSEGE